LKRDLEPVIPCLTIAPPSFPALKSGQLIDGLETVFRTMRLGLDPLDIKQYQGEDHGTMGRNRRIHEDVGFRLYRRGEEVSQASSQ